MRMLLVTPFVPHRMVGHGTATVASHFVDYFASRHDLSVLCFATSDEESRWAEEVAAKCSYFKALPFPGGSWSRRQTARALSLVSSEPFVVKLFESALMRSELERLIRSGPFDLVQMDCVFMAQYRSSFEGTGTKTSLLEIDVHTKPLRRRFEQKSSPWGRAFARREWRQMEVYEPRTCERFDCVYAVSAEDRDLLQSLSPGLAVSLFRYGADDELFDVPVGTRAGADASKILFLGSFTHRPNVGAALWFFESVLPSILAEVPDARFELVGGNPPPEIERLGAHPQVSVTGWVPRVADYLQAADVCVVPLKRGGGVKLKTLEMMAAGRAIVTTDVGCEGIDARDGEHLVVARSADEFSDSVVRLLRDENAREALGRSARDLALEEHSWASNLAHVERQYHRLLDSEAVAAGGRAAAQAVGDADGTATLTTTS